MSKAEVILSGFADEGPVSKRAEEQLTMMQVRCFSHAFIIKHRLDGIELTSFRKAIDRLACVNSTHMFFPLLLIPP